MDVLPRYEIILRRSDSDWSYIAEVPELPWFVAHGERKRDALAAVEVVMREWIETAKGLRRPISEPRGRRVS